MQTVQISRHFQRKLKSNLFRLSSSRVLVDYLRPNRRKSKIPELQPLKLEYSPQTPERAPEPEPAPSRLSQHRHNTCSRCRSWQPSTLTPSIRFSNTVSILRPSVRTPPNPRLILEIYYYALKKKQKSLPKIAAINLHKEDIQCTRRARKRFNNSPETEPATSHLRLHRHTTCSRC